MKHVDIYTDGACRGNPGKGGWSAILVYAGVEKEISGFAPSTTNNRMELTAAIEALRCLKYRCEVDLYSDSSYLVNAVNRGWLLHWYSHNWKNSSRRAVKNKELWKQFWGLLNSHEVTMHWVKGHNGHDYNERCDALANAAIDANNQM